MTDLSEDPIINVVHKGIKRDIQTALDNKCLRAAVILVYSGIDTMAYLGMPDEQEDVRRDDFVDWAERYIDLDGNRDVSGLDLYGARCAMLHSYSVASRLSREGKCKEVGYMVCDRAVIYNPDKSTDLVLVSVHHLAKALLNGIDQFLVHLFADKQRAAVANKRLGGLVHQFSYAAKTEETGQQMHAETTSDSARCAEPEASDA